MRKLTLMTAAALVAVATIGTSAPAQAGPKPPKPRIDLGGQGSYIIDRSGAAVITGVVTGRPVRGPYAARLSAKDGILPAPGECEPGVAKLYVDGPRRTHVALVATGDICGEWVQPPYVVTHVFTGRYVVTAASKRKLKHTDGFLEVRLATEGRASVFAIDT